METNGGQRDDIIRIFIVGILHVSSSSLKI